MPLIRLADAVSKDGQLKEEPINLCLRNPAKAYSLHIVWYCIKILEGHNFREKLLQNP